MILEPSGKQPSYKLVYAGQDGITTRDIALLERVDTEHAQYIYTYCFLRDGKRTFDTSRIISLTDLVSGRTWTNADFRYQFKPIRRSIRQTIGKDGKPYFYEKGWIDNDGYDHTWSRISKEMYEYYVEKFRNKAVTIDIDAIGNIAFLEWQEEQDKNRKPEHVTSSIDIGLPSNNEVAIQFRKDNLPDRKATIASTKTGNSGCFHVIVSVMVVALFIIYYLLSI